MHDVRAVDIKSVEILVIAKAYQATGSFFNLSYSELRKFYKFLRRRGENIYTCQKKRGV